MAGRTIPLLKTLIFTIVVPGSVGILIPHLLTGQRFHRVQGAAAVLGWVVVLAGTAIYLWCAWEFAYHGLGTPAPIDPPKVLVARGLNRFVRNPMYLGVLALVLGQAILFRCPELVVYAACFWLGAHSFVVLYEEPALHRKFGSVYDEYRRQVPRWIPRLRHSAPR
jgi:protein-S-isoprenylcysteine O-methyltransferase Ste14